MPFPMNIVEVLHDYMKAELDESFTVLKRPLRTQDPNLSVGIFPNDWVPVANSREMGFAGDTLSTHLVRVHLLIKAGEEQAGRYLSGIHAKKLRTMLAHDADLQLRLGQLSEVSGSIKERAQRFGVRNQRFLNNELTGQFIFLATTEFWVETETSRA